jgi:competence protein ComEA
VDERGWQTAAWAVAAIVATVIGVRLLSGGEASAPPVRLGTPYAGATAAPASSRATLYVHVAGAVRRPGLYRLRSGTRVAQAIERAGGPMRGADLTGVNLAARLEDGQQVVVPPSGAGAGGSTAAESRPSLGSATAEQLEELDGIGPTLAERIVERRTESGGFSSLDDLRAVEGIGEKRLEALKEALSP